jgi:hypothetical protein
MRASNATKNTKEEACSIAAPLPDVSVGFVSVALNSADGNH